MIIQPMDDFDECAEAETMTNEARRQTSNETLHPAFQNRREAGKLLALKLARYADRPDLLVLALPRGGVPVAFEVSQALRAPLDVFVVRKLGMPGNEELALGAIATGGGVAMNVDLVEAYRIPERVIESIAAREAEEIARRERLYRGDKPAPQISGRTVILIDDGLATGASMNAAIGTLRKQNPAKIVVGVPISAPEVCDEFHSGVDEIVCAITPEPFYSVGTWYQDFSPTTDEEVHELLEQADRVRSSHAGFGG
jgi:putative phosphoribosyl transferase